MAIDHTMAKVVLRWMVSMSGPGIRPWMRKTLSRMAIEAEPGTPKAMVGTSEPAVMALLADSGAMTPRTSPLPKVLLAPLTVCNSMAIGDPVDHRRAQPRNGADAGANAAAADDEPPVLDARP